MQEKQKKKKLEGIRSDASERDRITLQNGGNKRREQNIYMNICNHLLSLIVCVL